MRAALESSKSERERHDRPTWRRPCGRGAPRRARATAGGGRGGSPRRVLAGAGRTAIGEGLRGSRQKLIKPTCCPLTQANQRPSRLRTNGDGARLAAARVRVAERTARVCVAERAARVRVTERAARVRVTERAARVRVLHRGVRHRLAGAPPRPGRARVRRQGLPALHRDPRLQDCRVPCAPRHLRLDRLVHLHQVVRPERAVSQPHHHQGRPARRLRVPVPRRDAQLQPAGW